MASEAAHSPLDQAFEDALRHKPAARVDRDADAHDVTGFSLVCACGQSWLHESRCARCGVRNGNLICGLVNNHRGRHQAIALWR